MSIFSLLTEGGQTWIHRVRMIRQVLKIASILSIAFCGFILYIYLYDIPQKDYYASYYHLKARICEICMQKTIEVDAKIWEKIAHERRQNKLVPVAIAKNKTRGSIKFIKKQIEQGVYDSLKFSTLAFFSALLFFVYRGRGIRNSKHLTGRKIISAWKIRLKMMLTNTASNIKIGGVPMVKGSETRHTLITGGTGSGKTNCLYQILDQIRKSEQKTIIIDTTGNFVSRYYRESVDIILNPLDERSKSWNPWIECRDKTDYDSLAESFIPISTSDNENYWRLAARSLMSSVLYKLKYQQKTSGFCRWMLIESLSNLADFVEDTKAASHVDIKSEKTAASIRSVASSFLESFEYLEDTSTPFSIRDWIKEEGSGWLFLSCNPKQRTVMRPMLSSWMSVATRALFELSPSHERRVWFVIDELASMNKIKDLELLLTESRKYGGCALISLQSPTQLESIYGRSSTETIVSNCLTNIVFSEKNPKIAEEISRLFGKKECREYSEGLSYGANDVRDGVNLSSQKKETYCVTPNQIQTLKKNTAYINLPENMPIVKTKFKLN